MGDSSQAAPLLDQVDAEIGRVTADGAYGGEGPDTAWRRCDY